MVKRILWLVGVWASISVCAAAESPLNKRITVDYRNLPVADVLKDIGAKAGVRIGCAAELVQNLDNVNYAFKDEEAGRVLTRILRPRRLNIEQKGDGSVSVFKLDKFDEFKVKREEVYEFAEKPKVTREGDKVTIAFATKGWCDVTIAIENADGKIIRHLASGVLGENAPEPFQWNSKKQVVLWDGKNDKGEYVDDKDSHSIRVSLGLKPQFERTLFWHPDKGTPSSAAGPRRVVAAKEGVYVYHSGVGEHLRLLDHDGKYVRTVLPFPADKIGQVDGLTWRSFPGTDRPQPVKWEIGQFRLLNWDSNRSLDAWPSAFNGHGHELTAYAMAGQGGRLVLAGGRIYRLSTDGSPIGIKAPGPIVHRKVTSNGLITVIGDRTILRGKGEDLALPRSAALSPDGKWLYLTGYTWMVLHDCGGGRQWLPGVARVRADGDEPPTTFAGSFETSEHGKAEGKFAAPAGVACDAQGRVYVADHANDRIQVFDPEGKFLKAIPADRPVSVAVDPRSGELYVSSWALDYGYAAHNYPWRPVKPTVTRLGPLDNPRQLAQWPLPLRGYHESAPGIGTDLSGGTQYLTAIDFFTDPPSLWLSDTSLRKFPLAGETLVCRKDSAQDLAKETAQPRVPYHGRQRLYFDPLRRQLYVGEQFHPAVIHSKTVMDLVKINPETGRETLVKMPFDVEDFAFDIDGHIYVRTLAEYARFDPENWREVPFDYGIEWRLGVNFKIAPVLSCLQTHGTGTASNQYGGFCISPKGYLATTTPNSTAPTDRRDTKVIASVQKYEPPLFPGRARGEEVHVFDQHGKPRYVDAVTGFGHPAGIAMDKDDFLYMQVSGTGFLTDGKPHPNTFTTTLFKLRAGKTKIVCPNAPVPLTEKPLRPFDVSGAVGSFWVVEGLEWSYPGVGIHGRVPMTCHCEADCRFALDYYARSFASETHNYAIVVLDSAGNVVTRIGRYGNVDDGKPLVAAGGPPSPRSIGGDEVALMQALHLAVQTDRRLFLQDIGNYRLLSVKLGYHAEEKVALKNVSDLKKAE